MRYLILLVLLINGCSSVSTNKGQACPSTIEQNTSNLAWNNYDSKEEQYASTRCVQIWKDSPCLVLFRKYDFQQYDAICGYKR